MPPSPPKRNTRKLSRKRGHDQSFVNYLSFGLYSTACIACFLVTYALALAILFPLLQTTNVNQDPLETVHAPERLVEAASAVRSKLHSLRKGNGVTDESLLNAAKSEYQVLRARKRDERESAKQLQNRRPVQQQEPPMHKSPGFVVLGMHRSGTSMLSGLLVTACGYNVGGPLIGAAFDNERGFYERIDVVLQNDAFMGAQNIGWSSGVREYDAEKALEQKKTNKVKFKEGERALKFLNDPSNAPWLQKDPRMCITLKTWLKLLDKEPAVVFTYRHPMEVAMSLNKREKNFGIEHGLRLWIVYNMRAVQNSQGLCRVLSSNDAILADPLNEVQRISDELTSKCGVPSPPNRVTQEEVDKFVDPKLQHNKKKREEEEQASERKILAEYDGCKVFDYEDDPNDMSPKRARELAMYKKAMKVYCDFKSGKAYEAEYKWPDLE
jgi:hypothetical protein